MPPDNLPLAIVAGHVCLDIIPQLTTAAPITPGALIEAGPAQFTTGGAVANTGLALQRLGIPTRLIGCVGDDRFAPILRQLLAEHAADAHILTVPHAATSYSIVISPARTDRSFLHCPGVNHLFQPGQITDDLLENAALLHFGYPPAMRQTYADGGDQLADLFRRARALGLKTSLDTCAIDPDSPAGQVDWHALLARVLPHVDCFTPSCDELAAMLHLDCHEPPAGAMLQAMADTCLDLGCPLLVIKLANDGLFAAATRDADRLGRIVPAWADHAELRHVEPCFQVDAVGTTGAGDTTIAGLLAAILHNLPLPDALALATAAGACSVQHQDAITGIIPLPELRERLTAGWPKHPSRVTLTTPPPPPRHNPLTTSEPLHPETTMHDHKSYRFSFGPWNLSEGADPFGPSVRPAMAIGEKLKVYQTLGFDAVMLHDDDAVPDIENRSPQQALADATALRKRLEDLGLVVEITAPRLWEDPRGIDGPLTANDPKIRQWGIDRVCRCADICRALGTDLLVLWLAREGTYCRESKNAVTAHHRLVDAVNAILEYDKTIRIAIEPKPNEPTDHAYIPTIGHALALAHRTIDPDRVGGLIETAHAQLAGLDPSDEMAFALAADKLFSVHLNDQNGLKYDQDKAFASANLRAAFNQVRILEAANYKTRGMVAFDTKPMRTSSPEHQARHLANSKTLFLHLVDKVRTWDDRKAQQYIDNRDYEALELAILEHLLGV